MKGKERRVASDDLTAAASLLVTSNNAIETDCKRQTDAYCEYREMREKREMPWPSMLLIEALHSSSCPLQAWSVDAFLNTP